MNRAFAVLMGSLVLLAQAAPVMAHHSFAAEYDEKKPVTLKGVVTKVEWTNPHARFYVDVKDDHGAVINCWTRKSLQPGDQVIVTGSQAKDGTNMANARVVTLADGRKVFAGSSADGGPQQ
jgi:hypothetical protein